jgi:hypothetical protein
VGVRDIATAWDLGGTDDAVLEAWTWAPHVALPADPDARCALWRREAAERVARAGQHPAPSIKACSSGARRPPWARHRRG